MKIMPNLQWKENPEASWEKNEISIISTITFTNLLKKSLTGFYAMHYKL